MSEVVCFKCGHKMNYPGTVGRRDECSSCRSDVHVCKNCAHYDSKAYNECREPVAEVVKEKERANFCDQFTPGSGAAIKGPSKQDLLSAAEALFKKK